MILSGQEIDAEIAASELQAETDRRVRDRVHYHFEIREGRLADVWPAENVESLMMD